MSTNIVEFKFSGKAASQAVDFTVSDSRIKKDKTISNSDITINPGIGKLTINIDVSRNGNSDVANWYHDSVGNNTQYMMHTKSGSNNPSKLNFAIQGVLKIGDQEFKVCIGQGHYSTVNNWHMCSYAISARGNNKSAYLDNIYYISTEGSSTFEISYANEITQGKGFNLWTYTDSPSVTPRFDLEGDALHPFPFQESNLKPLGMMKEGYCFDTTGVAPAHRDFHLQLIGSNGLQIKYVDYKINRVTGSIEGNRVLKQTAINFTYNDKNYMMNYGVSHAALPLGNQSYIYAGEYNAGWMGDIAKKYPDLSVKDLVLSGSHDAGMYETNIENVNAAVEQIKIGIPILNTLLKIIANPLRDLNVFENVAVTQKDTAYTQLLTGTRYFDFRPAFAKGEFRVDRTYHIHGFIPGVLFSEFLQETNKFLQENKGEFAIIRIADSGIDKDNFTPLSKKQVESCLEGTISNDVGYEITTNIKDYNSKTLLQMAADKRLIILYDYTSINDSYNDDDYSQSLTDTSFILNALESTVKNSGSYQYTVLQLQNTGSSALQHYASKILLNPILLKSWANDLLLSGTGNILQATKPIFDHATYQWLTQESTIENVVAQESPVIVQNDFVDVALSQHAMALTLKRYKQRIQK